MNEDQPCRRHMGLGDVGQPLASSVFLLEVFISAGPGRTGGAEGLSLPSASVFPSVKWVLSDHFLGLTVLKWVLGMGAGGLLPRR